MSRGGDRRSGLRCRMGRRGEQSEVRTLEAQIGAAVRNRYVRRRMSEVKGSECEAGLDRYRRAFAAYLDWLREPAAAAAAASDGAKRGATERRFSTAPAEMSRMHCPRGQPPSRWPSAASCSIAWEDIRCFRETSFTS